MAARRAATVDIKGGITYAKVAERLRLFREENPDGKHESAYEVDVDSTYVFTVWLWKDKKGLLELIRAGVTDKEALRASADANGNAKGAVGSKDKDFEKLESVALGRALANLGYLASGEIASSEEMDEFLSYRAQQKQEAIEAAIQNMDSAHTLDELKVAFVGSGLMQEAAIVAAKDKRKMELTKTVKPEGSDADTN